MADPTRKEILRQAWPIILASASVPLLGLVDTAVIGHYGDVVELGALALGALLFNFIYWSFGFLRMATTGFVAQASGAGDRVEARAVVLRAVSSGVAIGLLLQLLHGVFVPWYFHLMDAADGLHEAGSAYVAARIGGAPAALALYGLCGALIGLGRSGALLAVQLVLNGLNAVLDVVLAGVLGMGVAGIGLGTAIAEWISCLLALVLVWRVLAADGGRWPSWQHLWDWTALRRMWAANADILVRTFCLLAGFAWFARQGSQLGGDILAANHLLLQLVAFCAFFLDGFAHVAESQVGRAIGAGDRPLFRRSLRLGSELAAVTALCLAVGIWLSGATILGWLTDLPPVLAAARPMVWWVGLYVLLSVAAFQLDGVFIGATATREMRNGAVVALALFLPGAWLGGRLSGNHGLWLAMVLFVTVRALSLWPGLCRLDRSLARRKERGSDTHGSRI